MKLSTVKNVSRNDRFKSPGWGMLTRHGDIKSSCQISGVMLSRHSWFKSWQCVKYSFLKYKAPIFLNDNLYRCQYIHNSNSCTPNWNSLLETFIAILGTVFPLFLSQIHRSYIKRWRNYFAKIETLYKLKKKITKSGRTYFCNGSLWYFSQCIFHGFICKKNLLREARILSMILHWNGKVVRMTTFSSLVAPDAAIETVLYAVSNRKVVALTAFPFQYINKWGECWYTSSNLSLQLALTYVYFHICFFKSSGIHCSSNCESRHGAV